MQLDAALAMSGLSREQAEEIFLLTHESTDAREEAHMQLHPVVPQRGTVPHGDPSHWV